MKDINFAEPLIGFEEKKNIIDAIDSKWLGKGKYVEQFEKKFSKALNVKNSISVNNGTNAFLLILMHLKIKPGDEIIVPSLCYISPIHMIKLLGATPVIVDVDSDSYQICPSNIKKKISSKTKAILMIHNFGSICKYVDICKIADAKKIQIIEDMSESIFSKIKNNFLGSNKSKKTKIISFSSLHSTKTITTGEGGIIFTNSNAISENLKNLRDHGVKKGKAYSYKQIGGNFRMSNLLASLGVAQLSKIKNIIKKKEELNDYYNSKFKNLKGCILQKEELYSKPIKWSYVVRFENSNLVKKIIRNLNIENTVVRPSFRPLDEFKYLNVYKYKINNKKDFINAKKICSQLILLPMHLNLKKNQALKIYNKINILLK